MATPAPAVTAVARLIGRRGPMPAASPAVAAAAMPASPF
jgi:hypothetical protein